jgi:phage shock protein A
MSEAWLRLIERLESGDIDEDIKKLSTNACEHVVKAFFSLADQLCGKTHSAGDGRSDDPQIQLENDYQELQSSLIQVRQAVAQSIATETQLEQQLSKNRDQAATWLERASLAVEQGNENLAALARQRQSPIILKNN